MKKIMAVLLAASLLVVSALSASPAAARGTTTVTGGGTGTLNGTTVFSHFGMGVVLLGAGAAQGHFECNMAGNAAVPGLHIMAVQGQVSKGTSVAGSANISGDGTLNMDGKTTPVHFAVTVKAGGPGVGGLQLTVTDPAGKLIVALPAEKVMTGGISIH